MSSSKIIAHRNSQKRIYEKGAEYFVTTVSYERHPYFKEPVLVELFIRDLLFAKELKQFDLFGYTVMPDHVHLLFQPRGEANYSEIMRSVKTNFSRDANDIILNRVGRFPFPSAGDVAPRRLRAYQQHYLHVVKPLHERFIAKHGSHHDIPKFQWQSSFLDHIIRDEDDYLSHLEYIHNNAVKHGLAIDAEQYPYMWIQGMAQPFQPD